MTFTCKSLVFVLLQDEADGNGRPGLSVHGVLWNSLRLLSLHHQQRESEYFSFQRGAAPHGLCADLQAEYYTYYGTLLDNSDHLNYQTNQHTAEITATAAQFAGLMALRLVHDHLLSLDVSRYGRVLTRDVSRVYKRVQALLQVRFCLFESK